MTHPTFPTYDTVDLFAGPGGWSLAAQRLGLREIGIEFDKQAHMTRRAAGFATIRDDVRNWGPANFPNASGLIASPPCQTFSAAGKGAGRKALDNVLAAVHAMGEAHYNGISLAEWLRISEQEHLVDWSDDRTGLVLEPLRWALEARELPDAEYDWLAFEQVPTVLPVWEAMAAVLRGCGYIVATGNLQAEQYGVPQTRKRAVLVASRVGPARLPIPTHSKFHVRDKSRLDPGVLPWVSMAQALGWDDGATVRSNYGSGGDPAARGERTGAEPAATVTGKVDRNRVLFAARFGNQENSAVRAVDEPAATVRYGERMNACDWVHERPATTVQGDPRVGQPGHKCMTESCHPGRGTTQQFDTGSVRVSVVEAGVLQSFPADFPWQGAETKQYQQVGNAIPPLLAEAVLSAVTDRPTVHQPEGGA